MLDEAAGIYASEVEAETSRNCDVVVEITFPLESTARKLFDKVEIFKLGTVVVAAKSAV